MYLIARKPVEPPDSLQREFIVMGTIGNVYNVTIGPKLKCTCPDFQNGNLCKHILFVFLKVLRVPANSSSIYQQALLSSELKTIFDNAPKDPTATVLASLDARQKYAQITGDKVEDMNINVVERKSANGEDCPICYEAMHETEQLVYCKSSCGKVVHKGCFEQWSKQQHLSRKLVTCVYCRADWPDDTAKLVPKGHVKEGYLNLSSYQPGVIPEREEYIPESYY